jgi:carbonic anhydrase
LLDRLYENNRAWSAEMLRRDPNFFDRLANQQRPQHFWIGCSDSRVPANEIVGLAPGELFVHRNVANLVVPGDLNCLSALQFAVDLLKVRHVIVCGHYGCSGVLTALRGDRIGLADQWLAPLARLRDQNRKTLDPIASDAERHNRFCELNVVEQVAAVCCTTVMQDAWARMQEVSVHGVIYGLKDGILRDLGIRVARPDELDDRYQSARAALQTPRAK